MKNKLFIKIIIVILSFLFCCPTSTFVLGAINPMDFNITVTSDRARVIVTGNVSEEFRGKIAAMTVLKPNKTVTDLTVSKAPFLDVVLFAEDCVIDQQGNYRFSFAVSGDSCEYTVRIGFQDYLNTPVKTFHYYNLYDTNTIIGKLNTGKTTGNQLLLKNTLEAEYDKLLLHSTIFEHHKTGDLTEFYTLFAKAPIVNNTKELEEQINDVMATALINTAPNITVVESLFLTYSSEYRLFGTTILDTFKNKINSSLRQLICAEFLNKNFENVDQITTKFKVETIRIAIKESNGWGQVKDVVLSNSALLQLDLTDYNNLSNQNGVFSLLEGRDYDSLAKVTQAFSDAVKSLMPQGGGGGTGGTGGTAKGDGSHGVVVGSPKLETQTNEVFNDLGGYEWAKESIIALYNAGIISGKSEGKYAPEAEITREEFVKLLVLVTGLELGTDSVKFEDVKPDEWYAPYIAGAVNMKVINGISETQFGIGIHITRQDMAVIAYRALVINNIKQPGAGLSTTFADVNEISDYALEAVTQLTNFRLLNGLDDGRFAPVKTTSRAEAAVFLYRIKNLKQ